MEFSTDQIKVGFVLSLLKEAALKWAILITEENDPVMANY